MNTLIFPSLLSGVLLTSLLPAGMLTPVNGPLFLALFCLAMFFHVVAVLNGVRACSTILASSKLRVPLLLFLVFLAVVVGAHSFLPPTARDALIHHLAVPKWWVEANRIQEIVWHDWSYYPMLLQLAFTGFLALGLEQCIALYHFSFALLLAVLVLKLLQEKTEDVPFSVFGFFVLLLLPIVLKLSSTQLVDLGLAFFSMAACVKSVHWVETRKRSDLLSIGVALGLAMGCKYNGFLFAALFLLCFLFFASRSKISFFETLFGGIVVGAVALIVVSPWLVKNALLTGNPVYPLFGGFFETAQPTPGVRGFKSLELRFLRYNETVADFILLPFKMLFWGEDGSPRWFDGRLSPLLLLGLVPVIRIRKLPWCAFFLLLLATYTYLVLLYSGPRVRYFAPLYGHVAVLASFGVFLLLKRYSSSIKYGVLAFLFLIQLVWSGYYYTDYMRRSHICAYFFSHKSNEDYFATKISEYEFAKYVNEMLPQEEPGVLYLLFTGNRFYYYDVPVRSGGHYAGREIIQWLYESSDEESFLRQFQERNIRYLGVHVPRLKEHFHSILPKKQAEIWNAFQRTSLVLQHYTGPYALWEIQ